MNFGGKTLEGHLPKQGTEEFASKVMLQTGLDWHDFAEQSHALHIMPAQQVATSQMKRNTEAMRRGAGVARRDALGRGSGAC